MDKKNENESSVNQLTHYLNLNTNKSAAGNKNEQREQDSIFSILRNMANDRDIDGITQYIIPQHIVNDVVGTAFLIMGTTLTAEVDYNFINYYLMGIGTLILACHILHLLAFKMIRWICEAEEIDNSLVYILCILKGMALASDMMELVGLFGLVIATLIEG